MDIVWVATLLNTIDATLEDSPGFVVSVADEPLEIAETTEVPSRVPVPLVPE
jgi:hypothetical protein